MYPAYSLRLTSGEVFQTTSDSCIILPESCQLGRFAFPIVTRSLTHICAGIAQHPKISTAGSNPVRVDLVDARDHRRSTHVGSDTRGSQPGGGSEFFLFNE